MRYGVGDKVRITETPNQEGDWVPQMNKWCGKVMTIQTIDHSRFYMEEDRGERTFVPRESPYSGWSWEERWLSPIEDEPDITIPPDKLLEVIGL